MADMLSPEQLAQFTQNLQAQDGGPGPDELPPEEAPIDPAAEGMDVPPPEGAPAEPPVEAPVPPQAAPDPNAEVLASIGFGSVEELAQAFQDINAQFAEMKDELTQLTTLQKAMGNENELDPNSPDYAVRSAVRTELGPLLDPVRNEIRNKLVQRAWGESAKDMPDLEDHKAEIMEFLKENSDLSVADDGLRRAYEAVRSKKYRPEADLLGDPEFRKRAMENPDLRNAIIQDHLSKVAKNGDVPSSIGEGGGSLLTGKKKTVGTMEEAKQGLFAALSKAASK